jgi:hypothetical protein
VLERAQPIEKPTRATTTDQTPASPGANFRPYRFLWTRRNATRAEIAAARERMIAAGRASAHDRFVIFSWNDSGLC